MFKRKWLVFAVIIAALFAFTIFLQTRYMPAVLMYHSVNPKTDKIMYRLIVSPQTFEKQMVFLKNHNYKVISLGAMAELLQKRKKIPFKTVAITFDDGFKDNYTYAYPVLKKLGFPATISLIFDEIGRPEGDRLSWEEIKLMQESGLITFASHTFGATPLVDISSEAELRKQIADSKKKFEEKLKIPIDAFTYVGGMFTPHIRELVIEAGYKYAVATGLGKKFSNYDVFAIKRVRISQDCDDLLRFRIKISGYYNAFRK